MGAVLCVKIRQQLPQNVRKTENEAVWCPAQSCDK